MDYNLPPDYEERKRKLLVAQGFDPLVDDLDLDTMSVVPRQEKPADNLEAFGTSAAYNLPEAASSVIGARLGGGIVSGLGRLLSKAPHPALKALGILGGALGAPMATAGLTQPIKEAVSPGVTDRLETMKLDSPWATGLGAQASALPFFKPSNPLRTALPNVAAGVGLGAGLPIAQDLAEGSDINIAEAVSGAVGGAFMSEPTRLGSWLGGLHPGVPQQQNMPTPDPVFKPRIVPKKPAPPVEPPIENSVLDTGEQTYPETGFEGWKPPVEKPLPLKQPQQDADWETTGGEYPQPDPTAPKPIQVNTREVQATPEDPSGPPAGWRDAKPINLKPGLSGELQDALAPDAPSEQATVGTSEQIPIREPNTVLQQQTALALDPRSTRSAVLFTPGEVPITPIPRGLVAMDTPHGTVYWNPQKTTVDRIMKAASGKVFDSTVLGMSDPWMVRAEGDRIVTTTSKSGTPGVAAEVVPNNTGQAGVQKAVAAQKQSVPGGETTVKTIKDAAQERVKAKTGFTPDELQDQVTPPPQTRHSGIPVNELLKRARKGTQSLINSAVNQARFTDRPFGVQVDRDGKLPTQELLGRIKATVPGDEWEMLKERGIGQFLSGWHKIPPAELIKWLDDNSLKVEVKKIKPKDAITAREKRLAEIEHQLETIDSDWSGSYGVNNPNYSKLQPLIDERDKLIDKRPHQLDSDTTIGKYGVEPKRVSDLIDPIELLVKVPGKPVFTGGHHGKSGENAVVFVRGSTEVLPDGRKVFHAFEIQSDWEKQIRGLKTEIKMSDSDLAKQRLAEKNHPLLKDSNRLGIKAAIDHALETGHDAIAISDADTAMLTEKHDQYIDTSGKIKQEDGMRANYDRELPSIASELTGVEPVKMSFGEHSNSQRQVEDYYHVRTTTGAQRGPYTSAAEARASMKAGESLITPMAARDNLILKNPDGSFKSDVTANVFSLDKVKRMRDEGLQFTLFNKDKSYYFGLPFSRSKIKSRYGPQDEPDIRPRARLNPFKSEVDKLRAGGPQQAELADSLDLLHNKHREYNGRYANPTLGALEKLTPEEQQRVYDVMIKEDRMNQDLSARLTTKEKTARTELRTALRQMATDQIAAGQGIKMTNGLRRTRGVDPFYAPNVIDQGVRRILSEGQGSKQFKDLERDFIQWQVGHGITNAEAEKRFTKILGTFSHAPEGNQFSFKAARMPEGIGLPDSWIERDPMRAFRTYINKFTKDRAFYDVIESDPRMMKMLGSEHYGPGATIPNTVDAENLTRDPQVQRILTSFIGADNAGKEPVISGVGRFVNSLLLGGPLTKLTDIGTVPFKALAYVPNGHESAIVKGIANWREGYKDAFDRGFNRRGGLVVAQDILGMGEKAADALSQAAEMVTKITGSEQLELVSRGLAQSIGNYIAESHLGLAKAGNQSSIKFLQKLGKDWQTANPKELGTRVGQLLQGRYDITNLPTWAMNGPAAPFVTMMRWSIEQTNNFVKHVVNPAIEDGNLGPFVKTLIGGVGGGLLLNEMREELSGKKPYTASWKELEEGKDEPGYKDAITYKMIGAAQVTGTAGILMEIIRQGYEELTGRMPQGFRYPVYEVGKDVLQRMVAGVTAIREGEDVEKVGSELTKDLLTRHVQIIRTVRNQLGKHGKWDEAKKDIDKSNMMRDEDTYNRMMDKPQAAKVQTPPSYSRLTEREFDKEEDLGKAASMVPGMIKRGVERAKGDPATLQSEMRKLSTIDVRGMPSPDRDPAGFARYYGWLEKTQGQEKARQLASEFMQRRARAEVKRDFIPKIRGQ